MAKATAKATAKTIAEDATKVVAKKIPFVSLVAGGVFAVGRLGSGVYHFCNGNTVRGFEELGKAGAEIASGAVACFPGPGTYASLAIDVGLVGWDIADGVIDSRAKAGKSTTETLLQGKLLKVREAIDEGTYSKGEFLECVFSLAWAKFGSKEGTKAADDAEYIDEMVKKIFDDGIFDGITFPTEDILKVMAKKGFSQDQVNYFKAKAKSRKRG